MEIIYIASFFYVSSFFLVNYILFSNIGLPMIMVQFPIIVVAFIPIVFIESYFISWSLKIKFIRASKITLITNSISSFIGVPLTWLVLATVQIMTGGSYGYGFSSFWQKFLALTWQAPWLFPYENLNKLHGFIALSYLFIYFFLASWWIEYWLIRKILKDYPSKVLRLATLLGNGLSYFLLLIMVALFLVFKV